MYNGLIALLTFPVISVYAEQLARFMQVRMSCTQIIDCALVVMDSVAMAQWYHVEGAMTSRYAVTCLRLLVFAVCFRSAAAAQKLADVIILKPRYV